MRAAGGGGVSHSSIYNVVLVWPAPPRPNHMHPGYSQSRAAGKFGRVLRGVVLSHNRLRKTLPSRAYGGGARTAAVASREPLTFV